jgi:hypothetical protein
MYNVNNTMITLQHQVLAGYSELCHVCQMILVTKTDSRKLPLDCFGLSLKLIHTTHQPTHPRVGLHAQEQGRKRRGQKGVLWTGFCTCGVGLRPSGYLNSLSEAQFVPEDDGVEDPIPRERDVQGFGCTRIGW